MLLASSLPALLRWPLVFCPLYALMVVFMLVVLFVERRRAGKEAGEDTSDNSAKALGLSGRRHQ